MSHVGKSPSGHILMSRCLSDLRVCRTSGGSRTLDWGCGVLNCPGLLRGMRSVRERGLRDRDDVAISGCSCRWPGVA